MKPEAKAIEYTLTAKKSKFDVKKIKNSNDAYEFIRNFYHEDINIYESAFILMINRANEAMAYAKISQGGVCGTVIDPKLICKYAVDSLASGIVLAHNHPSGHLKFSAPDINISKKVKQALSYIDTVLMDSLVITDKGYLSMMDEGQIL